MSVSPGFILSPQEERFIDLLGSGVAKWEAKRLGGYAFTHPHGSVGHGGPIWRSMAVRSTGDSSAAREKAGHRLRIGIRDMTRIPTPISRRCTGSRRATLPAMMDRPAAPGLVRFISDLPEEPDACKNSDPR